jgi:phage terminase small subunit
MAMKDLRRGGTVSKGLTVKHKRFVEEYMIDKNATQAALRAGYSKKTAHAIGHELLSKPHVAAAIEAGLASLAKKSGITAERVIAELGKMGFADIRKIFTPGGDLMEITDLDDDTAGAVVSVEVQTRPGNEDDDGNRPVEHVHKIRLADKRAALVDLGKHLGLWPNRVEHTGKDGGPIEYSFLERARRLAFILKQAAAEANKEL